MPNTTPNINIRKDNTVTNAQPFERLAFLLRTLKTGEIKLAAKPINPIIIKAFAIKIPPNLFDYFMTLPTSSLIAFLCSHHNNWITIPRWFSIHQSLGSGSWHFTNHAYRCEFRNILCNCHQIRYDTEGFSSKV